MSSITTKTGDKGYTSLADGQRVPKNSLWVEAYGTADELTSMLGLARAYEPQPEVKEIIIGLQNTVHHLAATIAYRGQAPDNIVINADQVLAIEAQAQQIEQRLPPLTGFILPGGNEVAASLHVARTICRRMERRLLDIHETFANQHNIITYVNRLSDFLFLLARLENQLIGNGDIPVNKANSHQ